VRLLRGAAGLRTPNDRTIKVGLLRRPASDPAQRSGSLTAACHGPVGLLPANRQDGSRLFQCRRITAFTNEEERLQALRSAPRGCWRAGCENVEPSSKLIAMSYRKSVCEQSDRSRSQPPGSPADAYAGSQTSALSTLTTLSTVRPVYVRVSDRYNEHCYLLSYAHGSALYR
jgi:hypothetical protein